MANDRVTINGVNREIDSEWVTINGVWRKVDKSLETVNGVWREAYTSYAPPSYNTTIFDKPYVRGGDAIMAKNEEHIYTIPQAQVLEAIANGYTKVSFRFIITDHQGSAGYEYPIYYGGFMCYGYAQPQGESYLYRDGQYVLGFDDWGDGTSSDLTEIRANRGGSCNLIYNNQPVQKVFTKVWTQSDGLWNYSSYTYAAINVKLIATFTK